MIPSTNHRRAWQDPILRWCYKPYYTGSTSSGRPCSFSGRQTVSIAEPKAFTWWPAA